MDLKYFLKLLNMPCCAHIKKAYSIWTILLVTISVLYYNSNTKLYKKENRVIQWDIISYYAYLPATFIYNDITLKFQENDNSGQNYVFWGEKLATGNYQIKTSMGLAILYSPFFAIAHVYASNSKIDNGGFSWPYKLALLYAALFYLIIGLWFLRKILLLYFDEKISALSILAIVFGSNLFFYSSNEGPMPHVFDFSLIIIFLYYTIKWHEKQLFKIAIILGILSGLISLIRPINILVGLIFIFYDFNWKAKVEIFWKKRNQLIILLIVAFIIWIPQFLYWKYISGSWLSYSYGDESFFWLSPQFGDVLFSFRKGLFIYSPILLLSIWGFILIYKKNQKLFWPLSIFSLIYLYTVSSWWVWWYGGSFGMRAMIDIFGVLTLPIAYSLQQIFTYKHKLKYTFLSVFIILLFTGIFHNAKYHYGSIHWDSMTKDALFKNYFTLKRKDNFEQWIKTPDYDAAKKGER